MKVSIIVPVYYNEDNLMPLYEDIKAKFEHGVLCLIVPKQEKVKIPEKKTIMIEG